MKVGIGKVWLQSLRSGICLPESTWAAMLPSVPGLAHSPKMAPTASFLFSISVRPITRTLCEWSGHLRITVTSSLALSVALSVDMKTVCLHSEGEAVWVAWWGGDREGATSWWCYCWCHDSWWGGQSLLSQDPGTPVRTKHCSEMEWKIYFPVTIFSNFLLLVFFPTVNCVYSREMWTMACGFINRG